MIDPWPNDEEMSEMCGCGHTLGQHTYGLDLAPCEHCPCSDIHDPSSCAYRTWTSSCQNDASNLKTVGSDR